MVVASGGMALGRCCGMARCRWCGAGYPENQFPSYGDCCSRKCQEEQRQNSKQKWDDFKGGLSNIAQQHAAMAEQQRAQEIQAQQQAMMAEQQRRMEEAEAEQQRIAQREATLKQMLFEFSNALDDLADLSDPTQCLAVVDGLEHFVESHEFSEHDLSQIGDKQYFRDVRKRAAGLIARVDDGSRREYAQFKDLYQEYQQKRDAGFNGAKLFPKKKHARLPKELRRPPQEKPEGFWHTLTGGNQSAEMKSLGEEDSTAVFKGGCGCALIFFLGLPGVAAAFSMIADSTGVSPGLRIVRATLPLLASLAFVAGGGWLMWSAFAGHDERKQRRQALQDREQSQRETELERWKRKRKRAEAELEQTNRKIDAWNAEVAGKRQAAKREFEESLEELRRGINGFLDRHPSLERYLSRV